MQALLFVVVVMQQDRMCCDSHLQPFHGGFKDHAEMCVFLDDDPTLVTRPDTCKPENHFEMFLVATLATDNHPEIGR